MSRLSAWHSLTILYSCRWFARMLVLALIQHIDCLYEYLCIPDAPSFHDASGPLAPSRATAILANERHGGHLWKGREGMLGRLGRISAGQFCMDQQKFPAAIHILEPLVEQIELQPAPTPEDVAARLT